MSKKVIVSVTNDLSTDQRVHKVCQSLLSMGFTVELVGRIQSFSQPIKREYVTTRLKTFFSSGPLFYFEFNIRLFFKLLFSKCNVLLSNDLDTLLANFLVSKFKAISLVYDSHELFVEVPELTNRTFKKKIWECLEAWILPKINLSYTVCESIANFYKNKYGLNMKVVRNVPYLVESSSSKNKTNTLIYQGGMNPGRGLELAIDMMEFLDDFKLKIIGDGQELNKLKNLVDQKGLHDRIVFLGRLPFEDLKVHTEQACIGILFEEPTGLSFKFSLPNKLFDYIHSNTPVMATPLKEVKRIIDYYQVGEFIYERSPEVVANQIKKMSKNIDEYKFSQAKKDLNWQNEFKKIECIFSPLLGKV